LFTILNAVKEQGFDVRKFSIEMDIESNGGGATQFPQSVYPNWRAAFR
jgi:hypothetical protein